MLQNERNVIKFAHALISGNTHYSYIICMCTYASILHIKSKLKN